MSLPFTIIEYVTTEGKSPFGVWFSGLRDPEVKRAVTLRLARVQMGNLGDYRSVGEGVCEIRIHQGAGRVYFVQEGDTVILLLCAGDKRTQDADIQKAKKYLRDYERRKP
jgi:putative addiction module killer protein